MDELIMTKRAASADIAIVGMGCRFPGNAIDLQSYWSLLCRGGDAVEAASAQRFTDAPQDLYAAFITHTDAMDAAFFGVSPREAVAMDPQHRLLLEVAWEALEDAGIAAHTLKSTRTGVFMGLHASDYEHSHSSRSDLYDVVGGARNAAAGRISYALGVQGPSFVIDADRASSLVAVHAACKSLQHEDTRLALAGGANLLFSLSPTLAFARAGMLAADGRCKFGDARADGFVRAEGVGVVVLKPLAQALEDGNAIYAVIRGSAISHMGSDSGDLMTPSQGAQESLLRAAYADAGVDPRTVQYVEAHGTGTPAGDPVECKALGAVLGAGRAAPCWVGSVKSNIGHTEAAAGIAGLIKTALMLHHGQLVRNLHHDTPNPHIPFASLHLQVPTAAAPLPGPGCAGVSGFGLTGSAAHVVLESAPAAAVRPGAVPQPGSVASAAQPVLLPMAARHPNALSEAAEALALWLAQQPAHLPLQAVGAALARQRSPMPHRLAVWAQHRAEAEAGLQALARALPTPHGVRGGAVQADRAVFVFSGHGAQWPGMGRDLLHEPVFRAALEACDAAIGRFGPPQGSLLALLQDPAAHAWTFDVTQPAMFGVSVALAALWRSWGVEPAAVVGASLGEAAAAYVAGALSLEDAAAVVVYRSKVMRAVAGRGAMILVELSTAEAQVHIEQAQLQHSVGVAASNSPLTTVISGDAAAMEQLTAHLTGAGVHTRAVRMDVASHTPLMDPLLPALQAHLQHVRPRPEALPIYSSVAGGAIAGSSLDADYWCRNLRQSVLFGQAARAAMQAGGRVFLEVSAHPLMGAPLLDNLQHLGLRGSVMGSLRRDEPAPRMLTQSLAQLYACGLPVRWENVYPGPTAPLQLPHYAWQRQRFWPAHATEAEAELLSQAETPETHETPETAPLDLAARVALIVGQVLGQGDALDATRPLRELGLTSILSVELRTALSDALGQPLPATLLFNYPTLEQLTAHLHTLQKSSAAPSLPSAPRPTTRLRTPQEMATRANAALAIVGMACRFPGGAHTPEAYWDLLARGQDAVVEIPADRWEAAALYDPSVAAPGKMTTRWGGFLQADIAAFDPEFFNLTKREAERMDPQQRLLLEVTWEALQRAGQPPEALQGSNAGVFLGCMNYNEYASLKDLAHVPQDTTPYDSVADANSVAAGRLAYLLGVHGPCMSIDTACSSSLVALHVAAQSLRAGECNVALVGGVNLILTSEHMIAFSKSGMMSLAGKCRTFDARADGYVRAEGCGVLVVKTLAQAQAQGDTVLAIVRSTAINQDGRSNGLTAPNGRAQEALLQAALKNAGLQPSDIDCIEAHGTGTPLGDPIEMQALSSVMGERAGAAPLIVGSVKTNLGHLEAAAGMAGLMKMVLSMQHAQVPPHLHFETLNPHIHLDPTRLHVAGNSLVDWPARTGKPRRGGVSSFGFSGTNAHVLLQEAPAVAAPTLAAATAATATTHHLLPLSARSPEALRAGVEALLQQFPSAPLAQVAATAGVRRSHYAHRLAVHGDSAAAWQAALGDWLAGTPNAALSAGTPAAAPHQRVVFVFPGQGGQWLGMGRSLLHDEPAFAKAMQACDRAIAAHAGWSVLAELQLSDAHARLESIDVVQPMLFAMQVALAALWRAWGVQPAAIVGHSMGEVAAAHVAGALSLDAAAQVIVRRSQLMRAAAGKGAMLAVDMAPAEAETLIANLPGNLSVAVRNSPQACCIAGDVDAVLALQAQLQGRGVFAARVKADVAPHSIYMEPLVQPLEQALAALQAQPPQVPMWSTVSGEIMAGAPNAAYWGRNLRQPVRFDEAVQRLLAADYRTFVEISPHPVLTAVLTPVLKSAGDGVMVASTRRKEPERAALLHALGSLYSRGVTVNFAGLTPKLPSVHLPTYAWQRQRCWIAPASPRPQPTSAHTHPLLGRHVQVAHTPGLHVWDTQLSVQSLPMLMDHQVGDAVVLPAAAYVEMALAAVQAVRGAQASVGKLTFQKMLLLPPQTATPVQTLFENNVVQIRSLQGEDWVLHAEGMVHDGLLTAADMPPLKTAGESLDASEFYARMDSLDLHYGPAFRGVQQATVWPTHAQGTLLPPASGGFGLNPAHLDAALQLAVLQAMVGREPGGPWLPMGVEALQVHGDVRGAVRVHVTRAELQGNSWRGHIRMQDAEGAARVTLQGVRLQHLQAAVPAPLLMHRWVRVPALPQPAAAPRNQDVWLLCGQDNAGLTAALQQALSDHGAQAVRVLQDSDLPSALAHSHAGAQQCRGVVHLGSLAAPPLDTEGALFDAAMQASCLSVLHTLQAMVREPFRTAPRLVIVTGEAQAVRPGESVAVEQTPVWGMARTLAYEHPDLRCCRIDVARPTDIISRRALAEALACELLGARPEDEVALRVGGQRFVGRLGSANKVPSPRPQAPEIVADATYLITGGLGGLGLTLAQTLVQQGAQHLLLSGRSAPSSPEQERLLAALRTQINVQVLQADVSVRTDVARLLSHIQTHMPPLRGIIHLAGILDDGLAIDQTDARMRRVLGPKALGAWHLHSFTRALELDFMVLYASMASLLGSPGQTPYAAANGFLDGLAELRRAQGLAVLSINWGPFSEVGLAAAAASRGARLAQRGMQSLTPAQGSSLLLALLPTALSSVGVVPLNARQWLEFYPRLASNTLFTDLRDAEGAPQASSNARARLLDAPPEQRMERLELFLRQQIAGVLRSEPQRIGLNTPLKELGVESLIGLELRNQLEAALGVQLSATLTWAHPTLAALVRFFAELLQLHTQAPPAVIAVATQQTVYTGAIPPEPSSNALAAMSPDELIAALEQEL